MTPKKTRLHRSELAVPGSNVRMLEKAPSLGADVVMLDLEDAVAPDDKEQARINLVDALREQDWSRCSVSVRINGLDTHWCYRDIVDVVEQAGEHVDAIVIPKVSGAGDVHLVATLLTQIEEAMGLERKIGLAVLIETAIGMVKVDEVAQACPDRMEAMIFGVADYAASIQSHTASIGGVDENYSVLTDPERIRVARAATGATSGTTRSRASPSPAAHTASGRSTGRTATSPTPRATSRRRAARPCSATRASGRSTPRRSSWRTRSTRPRRGSWSAPAGSSRR